MMDRNQELLQNDELYVHCGEIIKKNIATMKQRVFSLRDYLGGRKREIIKELRIKADQEENSTLEAVKRFYEHILQELVKMEEMCEEYLIKMKLDLLAEARDRLQSSFHVSFPQIEKAFKETFQSCGVTGEAEKIPKLKTCTWKNVPMWNLQNTIDILNKPKVTVTTGFDKTDLKFKQEMTIDRAKIFLSPETKIESRFNEYAVEAYTFIQVKEPTIKNFIEELQKHEAFPPSVNDILLAMDKLKFINGEFVTCEIWSKVLDVHGKQMRSKWLLVFCPQIGKIMNKRRIHMLHLNPLATFNFLSGIPENGFKFSLTKKDLLPLLQNFTEEAIYLTSWNLQLTYEEKNIAATMIQALWRGYWLRRKIYEFERQYIAASIFWLAWITVLRTRQAQRCYFNKILISLDVVRQSSLIFSNDFNRFIGKSHVILYIPSLGYPMEIRRTIDPRVFAIMQNTMSLGISFVRNPNCEVIYVLPVEPNDNLLCMYRDIVNSVDPDGTVIKRITFMALSELRTFQCRSLNVSRILHCSEITLRDIRTRIAGKPAYILPWIVDNCDVRLADNLGLPILGPDLELQREYLNFSRISEILEELDLPQPVHARGIKDYATMCSTLANLIVINTEICMWFIMVNSGIRMKHCGTFLINRMSIPFMPLLRKEREKFGDEWKCNSNLRAEFLDALLHQLPEVVSKVTRLSNYYASWKEFYAHVQKFGCFLQAMPAEKDSIIVAVSLFIPGLDSGNKPKWIGTADKIHCDTGFKAFAYMLPQSSIDSFHLEPTINKFALAVQERGYFGYLTIDCLCYPYEHKEDIIVLIFDIHPYYCHIQQYIDWLKFAISGQYSQATNTFNTDVAVLPMLREKSPYALESLNWDETITEKRYAIAISQLYHDDFTSYQWSQLKTIIKESDISYDATMKEGCHLIFYDSKMRNSAMFIAISSRMSTAINMTHTNLLKLYNALCTESEKTVHTNLQEIANIFAKLSLKYQTFSMNQCI